MWSPLGNVAEFMASNLCFLCPVFFLWHISLLEHFRISFLTEYKKVTFLFGTLSSEEAKRIAEIRDLFYKKMK
jgi:hypothetical protein